MYMYNITGFNVVGALKLNHAGTTVSARESNPNPNPSQCDKYRVYLTPKSAWHIIRSAGLIHKEPSVKDVHTM